MATAVAEVDGVMMVAREESQAMGIRTSRSIGQLAEALAAAQAAFPVISKDRTAEVASRKGEASSYSYHYADLADVLSAVRPHLAANRLAILQPMVWDGTPKLVTCLVHASGEWINSEYRLTEYERPQDMGSAITYARRYALTALLGIAAEEDDDGARAQVGRQRRGKAMPDCPTCHTPDRVIQSKFGAGFYCHQCKGKFTDPSEEAPAPAPQAEPDDPFGPDDWPNDTTAHERHNVEPARKAERAKPESAPASSATCPICGKPGGASQYPKPGKTHYCRTCKQPFEPAVRA